MFNSKLSMTISIDKMKRVILTELQVSPLSCKEHASSIGLSWDDYVSFCHDRIPNEAICVKVSNYIIKKYGRRCILK